MSHDEVRQLAGRLTAGGFHVFPTLHKKGDRNDKKPGGDFGVYDATSDLDQFEKLLRSVRIGSGWHLGLGVYPGASGHIVLDPDVKDGGRGLESLAYIESAHGPLPGRRVRTPSGGLHIWMNLPYGYAGTIGNKKAWPDVDTRCHKGYVIAPGVSVPWGGWTPESGQMAEIPATVLAEIEAAWSEPKQIPEVAEPGDRHESLVSLAAALWGKGLPRDTVLEGIRAYNAKHCIPAKPDSELVDIVDWVVQQEGGPQPTVNLKLPGDRPSFRLVDPATIEPRALEWAWQHRIATGTLTILAGRGGIGKGALWVDLTAKLTQGTLDGDLYGEPASVLILTAEERIADVVGPRLRAAGADLSRVRVMTMLEDDFDRDATFPDDLPAVREAIEQTKARLVIVDPLNAHLADRIDSHKDAPLRRALGPLTRLAGETSAAVLGVAHVNKGTGDAVDRVLGSVGYVNASRGLLIVGPPPDADADTPVRVVALPKANNTAPVPSLRFELEGRKISGVQADGTRGEIEVVGVTWKGEDTASAEDLLGTSEDRTALGEAVDWLRQELADGSKEKRELVKAARSEGIAERTLHRARKHLRVDVYRDESRQGRPSTWILPVYVPIVSVPDPLAHKPQGSDQGVQPEIDGYVPSAEDGTKPPNQCPDCGLSGGRHGSVCPFREPTPEEIAP